MIRPEIGVTDFLSQDRLQPYECTFKQLYSDFIVLEVLENGQVCRIEDGVVLEESGKPTESDVPVPSKLTETDKDNLAKLVESGVAKVDVTGWNKDERRELHVYIRSLGHFDSATEGDSIKAFRPNMAGRGWKRKAWPRDIPEHLHFTLSKQDYDTNYAVALIAKFLNRTPKSFGQCGLKDRRAISAQRISGYHVEASELVALNRKLRGIRVSAPTYEQNRLGLGDLWGNRFEIVLRDFGGWDDPNLAKRISDWETNGFINYFGDQRFGSFEVNTAEVGLQILKKDYERAVQLILQPKEGSNGLIGDCLREFAASGDARAALARLKGGLKHAALEQHVLQSLAQQPTNHRAALLAIPRLQRSLYLHAYQARVFNQVASRRARRFGTALLPADLFASDDAQRDIAHVVLPLPAFPLKLPQNEVGSWYETILAEDGLNEESFKDLHKDFAVSESFRPFLARPQDVSYKLVGHSQSNAPLQNAPPFCEMDPAQLHEDLPTAPFKALLIQFSLKSGTYATMALRELVRVDLSKAAQKEKAAKSAAVREDGALDEAAETD